MPPLTVAQRAARIKLLVLDIDGVLTPGNVVYDHRAREIKFFNVRDGHGIKLFQREGGEIALITGRGSEVNRLRAAELGIEELHQKALLKLPVFRELLERKGLKANEAAFMGDDLIDLPPMRLAGLALAPADAVVEVRQEAHWISRYGGGQGAVRQAIELIMKAKGTWAKVISRYYDNA